ncbi:MAG TPA: chorismate mutase [Rhabdochlamydiaceae bacterium]|nr:chorismate mutase [Rhabdochlamydiaceae bacterium]
MKFILILTSVASFLFGNNLFGEEKDLNHYYEIAKQNCQDIPSIREEMDRINNDILRLLTERSAYVKRAGDLKSKTTKVADDRQRVADQEKKIFDKSIELGLPTDISLPAFKVIMETSIQFQQQYIDHLSLEGT